MIYISTRQAGYDPLPQRHPGTHAHNVVPCVRPWVAPGVFERGHAVRYSRDMQTLVRLRGGLMGP
jgi:hypothetical protein